MLLLGLGAVAVVVPIIVVAPTIAVVNAVVVDVVARAVVRPA